MRDKFVRYARQLESLSISELSRGAENLVSRERRYIAALIAHLAEISRRKGHLELGFKSLFEYCRIHLGLGKGSVWSRTQLANVSRRFPQVLQHLVEGKASLSSLGVLAAHLSKETARPKTRLDEAAGAKKREERAGSRAFQEPLGAQASRLHLSRYIPSSVRERLRPRCSPDTVARCRRSCPGKEETPIRPELCFLHSEDRIGGSDAVQGATYGAGAGGW